ncbi:TPA: helix-turn-helix domain-containing protein [Stenotrophomonas maltophilia]|uniref:Helix-turn-helix domain-containing protein n=1 Tax=Stenotrophomonas forensis TaxID=2871169 RepID=A0ABY7XWT4_9GAMM|nr:helix-turn-helix domain-containing protein [Stenotrophomonas maltophilia]WDM62180.1 helix-turn-helix domain-containing protein [Stenotrophomonas sp. DFS-20110405]ALA82929.1 transcriptional regulator [Stenotrophomonas maltophilia]MBH1480145.1 helix-turn-helix domain-containing protein [Stenotrophomonas maltophilia]MBH1503092.1 helix-turn-helix domain-containing protein [Stenotrophomonas maltophilia]MBH1787733.1 helix-turn-helix domain-containing protein [Stenotrophomonas maltophilia]
MAWIYNSSMSSPALPWNGTLLLDAHVAVLQGHAGGSAAHAHYAHQLLLSDGAAWQVEVDGVRQQGQRLWLPSFQSHAILSAPQDGCTVFLEPAHADPTQIQRYLHALPGNAVALQDWLPRLSRPQPLDRRVQAALARITHYLPGPVPAADIAEAAHLSTSQLHRRFQSDLSVTLRGWVLWQRLRNALAHHLRGHSLTDSAHAAGFADLAHLSRNLHRMFGIGAAQLQGLQLRAT